MVDCVLELQKAVFAALDDDATLSGLITGVYNHVPQGSALPYVSIAAIDSSPYQSLSSSGVEIKLQINIYSNDNGSKEVVGLANEVKRILHNTRPTLTGCEVIFLRNSRAVFSKASDGKVWEGKVEFVARVS